MTIQVFEKSDFGRVTTDRSALNGVEGAQLEREQPDAHLVCENSSGVAEASVSIWYTEVPVMEGKKLGTVGHFAATTAEAAAAIIEEAERKLAEVGCNKIVGPMDGNTWRRYRFLTKSEPDVPPFFLEPWNPSDWPQWFEQRGWQKLAGYSSSRIDLQNAPLGDRSRLARRLESSGVSIRPIEMANYSEELQKIFHVCVVCFANNFLYTPLSECEFLAMYGQVEKLTVPDFVRLAEVDGAPVGFVFSIPDAGELQAKGTAETLIVKTLAVLPERRFAGLGTVLVEQVQEAAAKAGYRWAIHALQYESNTSLRITNRHGAKKIREYTLYAKDL